MAWNQLLYQMTLCRFAIAIAADAAAAAVIVVVAMLPHRAIKCVQNSIVLLYFVTMKRLLCACNVCKKA